MANGKKTDAALVDKQVDKIRVLELRQQFKSFRDIAAELGISVSTAHDYFQQAMEDIKAVETREALAVRIFETENMQLAAAAIRDKVVAGNLPAIDRWVRISERISKLWGGDAAIQQNLHLLMGAGGIEVEPSGDYRGALTALAPVDTDEQ